MDYPLEDVRTQAHSQVGGANRNAVAEMILTGGITGQVSISETFLPTTQKDVVWANTFTTPAEQPTIGFKFLSSPQNPDNSIIPLYRISNTTTIGPTTGTAYGPDTATLRGIMVPVEQSQFPLDASYKVSLNYDRGTRACARFAIRCTNEDAGGGAAVTGSLTAVHTSNTIPLRDFQPGKLASYKVAATGNYLEGVGGRRGMSGIIPPSSADLRYFTGGEVSVSPGEVNVYRGVTATDRQAVVYLAKHVESSNMAGTNGFGAWLLTSAAIPEQMQGNLNVNLNVRFHNLTNPTVGVNQWSVRLRAWTMSFVGPNEVAFNIANEMDSAISISAIRNGADVLAHLDVPSATFDLPVFVTGRSWFAGVTVDIVRTHAHDPDMLNDVTIDGSIVYNDYVVDDGVQPATYLLLSEAASQPFNLQLVEGWQLVPNTRLAQDVAANYDMTDPTLYKQYQHVMGNLAPLGYSHFYAGDEGLLSLVRGYATKKGEDAPPVRRKITLDINPYQIDGASAGFKAFFTNWLLPILKGAGRGVLGAINDKVGGRSADYEDGDAARFGSASKRIALAAGFSANWDGSSADFAEAAYFGRNMPDTGGMPLGCGRVAPTKGQAAGCSMPHMSGQDCQLLDDLYRARDTLSAAQEGRLGSLIRRHHECTDAHRLGKSSYASGLSAGTASGRGSKRKTTPTSPAAGKKKGGPISTAVEPFEDPDLTVPIQEPAAPEPVLDTFDFFEPLMTPGRPGSQERYVDPLAGLVDLTSYGKNMPLDPKWTSMVHAFSAGKRGFSTRGTQIAMARFAVAQDQGATAELLYITSQGAYFDQVPVSYNQITTQRRQVFVQSNIMDTDNLLHLMTICDTIAQPMFPPGPIYITTTFKGNLAGESYGLALLSCAYGLPMGPTLTGILDTTDHVSAVGMLSRKYSLTFRTAGAHVLISPPFSMNFGAMVPQIPRTASPAGTKWLQAPTVDNAITMAHLNDVTLAASYGIVFIDRPAALPSLVMATLPALEFRKHITAAEVSRRFSAEITAQSIAYQEALKESGHLSTKAQEALKVTKAAHGKRDNENEIKEKFAEKATLVAQAKKRMRDSQSAINSYRSQNPGGDIPYLDRDGKPTKDPVEAQVREKVNTFVITKTGPDAAERYQLSDGLPEEFVYYRVKPFTDGPVAPKPSQRDIVARTRKDEWWA